MFSIFILMRTLLRHCVFLALALAFLVTDNLFPEDQRNFTFHPLPFSEYIRFNRVEGLYLGVGIGLQKIISTKSLAGVYLSVGYATSARKERYNITTYLGRQFGQTTTTLIASLYPVTETLGFHRMDLGSNSVTSLFLKEDYLDFYSRRGIQIALEQKYGHWRFMIGGQRENNYSLFLATQKSLSFARHNFRENPVASLAPEVFFWRFLGARGYVNRIHKAGMLHMATWGPFLKETRLYKFENRRLFLQAMCAAST